MSAIPFDAWLRLAALHFHISPQEFWRLSLKEWRALSGGGGGTPLGRDGLAALIRTYPDKRHEN